MRLCGVVRLEVALRSMVRGPVVSLAFWRLAHRQNVEGLIVLPAIGALRWARNTGRRDSVHRLPEGDAMDRRDFLRTSGALAVGATACPCT